MITYDHPLEKILTEVEVNDICKMMKDEIDESIILEKYSNLTINDLKAIRGGCVYRYVRNRYILKPGNYRPIFNDDEVHKICKLLEKGVDNRYILQELGLEKTKGNYTRINKIRKGVNYKSISSQYNL